MIAGIKRPAIKKAPRTQPPVEISCPINGQNPVTGASHWPPLMPDVSNEVAPPPIAAPAAAPAGPPTSPPTPALTPAPPPVLRAAQPLRNSGVSASRLFRRALTEFLVELSPDPLVCLSQNFGQEKSSHGMHQAKQSSTKEQRRDSRTALEMF